MEYKYQIGEIVFVGNVTSVVTAHGVYLDGENAIPSYHVTDVNEAIGTRTLPLTDTRIHRNSSMKSWLREGQLCGHNDYISGLIQKLEAKKIEAEKDIQGIEEKIKWFKDLLSPGNDSPSGYVIRTHSLVNPDAILGFVAMEGELGNSLGHLARKVYMSELVAIEDAAKYNRLNPSLCFAVVIPNGTEEECLTAEPLWEEEEE